MFQFHTSWKRWKNLEIFENPKYLNNENQIMKKHCKNVVTKQNCNTYNQICSKITPETNTENYFV